MTLIYEKQDRLAYITINRPEAHNALDFETARELNDAFEDFRDDDNLWVAVLTGAGDQSFCSGADLKSAIPTLTRGQEDFEDVLKGRGGITQNFDCWKPIIAVVNGHCIAGGMELMLACDLRIASENAVFGLAEVCWGIIPAGGGTQRLPRAVPLSRAMEMILTGKTISAHEAYRIDLINKVVPQSELMEETQEWVRTLLARGPLALRAAKQAVLQGLNLPISEGLALEQRLFRGLLDTEDAVEGPKAFKEKRRPVFKGK